MNIFFVVMASCVSAAMYLNYVYTGDFYHLVFFALMTLLITSHILLDEQPNELEREA